MSGFLKAFGFLSLQKVMMVLSSIVRTKAAALLLGVSGMGLFSQAANLINMAQQIILMGIGTGFIKQVAEAGSDKEWSKMNQAITAIIIVVGCGGGLMLTISVIAGPYCSELLFGSAEYSVYVQLALAAALCVAFTQVNNKILQGLLRWRELALLNTVIAIAGAVSFILLTYVFETIGAIIGILVLGLLGLVLIGGWIIFITSKKVSWTPKFEKPGREIWMELGKIGAVMSIGVVLISCTNVYIRSKLIHSYGPDANGLYQVAYAISRNYLMLLASTIYAYGTPQVSSMKGDLEGIIKVQNRLLRLVLLIFVPGLLILVTFRREVIILLFSEEFLPMSKYLWVQLTADLLMTMQQTLSVVIVPLRFLRFYMITSSLFCVLWISNTLYFLDVYTFGAPSVAYLVSCCVFLTIAYTYQYLKIGYRVHQENQILLLKGCITIAFGLSSAMLLKGRIAYFVPIGVLGTYIIAGPSRLDRNILKKIVYKNIEKINKAK